MTRVIKTPFPVSAEDVEASQIRQAERAANAPLRRGEQAALAQELMNVRGAFNQGLADLKKATVNRDKNTPGRDAYDRCYQRVTKAGERLALIAPPDEQVRMPAWLAPPDLTEADTVIIGKPAFDAGTYTETKGLGSTGKGLPLKGPGSNTDPEWMAK